LCQSLIHILIYNEYVDFFLLFLVVLPISFSFGNIKSENPAVLQVLLKNRPHVQQAGVDCRVPHGFLIFPLINPKKLRFT